ncbi:hypothetical protein LTR08_002544 [Meristemomyces frigidus]|nr:hypothetical protein LTR08_002544 [Meristemomyces frigidus]
MNVLKSYVSPTRISQPASLKGKAGRHLAGTSIKRLVRVFVAWKLLLLLAACASPGSGYDTSTQILFDQSRSGSGSHSWLARAFEYVVLRLTRWDGIYFATAADRGHIYEQQWAFSWLMSKFSALVARVLFSTFSLSPIAKHALAGILISHLSHFFAVTTIYRLIYTLAPANDARKRQLAFITACLHTVSPAGLFLSAPYGEATFALFNFLGLLCYVTAIQNRFERYADAYQVDAFWTLAAGMWFALATMVRSNGLLSGILFAWDALATVPRLNNLIRNRDAEELVRLSATLVAGTVMIIGFAIPQSIAYAEYCIPTATRPWCSAFPPSIYTFVQSHYWNVGFLRYWTVPNIPLFALAFPLGWIMVETAIPSFFQAHHINRAVNGSCEADRKLQPYPPLPVTSEERVFQYMLPRLALPQVVLVGLAATTSHCQILNRISSGYPLWYFIIALEVCLNNGYGAGWSEDNSVAERERLRRGEGRRQQKQQRDGMFRLMGDYDRLPWAKPEWIVRGMMVYAVVQGGLFASFLPPA